MRALHLVITVPAGLFGLGCLVFAPPAARAADLVLSTTNDSVGDGEDRWRSAAGQASLVFDADEASSLFGRAGGGFTGDAAWEVRIRAEVITPDRDASPVAQDRLFADTLAPALVLHERLGAWRGKVGIEVAFTGEGTGVRALQEIFHEIADLDDSYFIRGDARIGGGVHPTGLAEVAYVASAYGIDAVPFVDGMVGIETLGRAGFDLHLGGHGLTEGWVRNTVTGTPIVLGRPTDGWHWGLSAGGDVAGVADSEYFERSDLPGEETVRYRARIGGTVSYQSVAFGLGLSYLSAENKDAAPNSDEGQFVGAITLSTQF